LYVPKSKALPDRYPEDGPVSIPQAYSELSQEAFAVLLRLAVEPRDVLRRGRGKIARLLSYSERRSNEVLRELHHKGYVQFITGIPGTPTEIVLQRRVLINQRIGHFARL
jgi:hypothetical protein